MYLRILFSFVLFLALLSKSDLVETRLKYSLCFKGTCATEFLEV